MSGVEDILARIERVKALMDSSERAEDIVYEKRLAVCRGCDRLVDATCQRCGCFVEIRALPRNARCPGDKWE